jgi:hypothetical protein
MKVCQHCGKEVTLPSGIQRTDSCPSCLSELKCCLNCRFFDPRASHECREPQADWVIEKARANFCEFFEFREVSSLGRRGDSAGTPEAEGARAAFESLFRKK